MAELEGMELQNAHLDIHELFAYYNDLYFEGKLGACNVAWSSSRMTTLASAAGICKFGSGGCEIRLSEPVLKSRTTAELKMTLLHEMIHAYLFSTSGNKDHDDHGPCFQHLMRSINQCSADDDQRPENGYNISICHNLEDEADVNQVHHSKCDSDTRCESDSPAVEKKQSLDAGSKTPPATRLRNHQELEMVVRETVTQQLLQQTNGVGVRKRRRPPPPLEAAQLERQPTVILAWKQWCMFEDDDEDGDLVGSLVNKRDKRRVLERHKKVMLREHNHNNSNNNNKTANKAAEAGVIVAGVLLPGSTPPAREEQKDRQDDDDDDVRQQAAMDPTNFSTPEESMVVNPLPAVTTATLDEGAKMSDESMVQRPSTAKVLTDEKLRATDKRKGHGKGDKRCAERRVAEKDEEVEVGAEAEQEEELEADFVHEEEESEANKKAAPPSAQATSIVDNEKDSMKGSNMTDNHPNELFLAKLPSTSRSQEEWYQGCEPTAPGDAGINGLYEEQGESTGGLTDVATQRGKQKVIELSDEEEDSNRVSIERQAMSAQNSIHSLDDRNADGRATTSGIEISSVCLERGLGSAAGTVKKQHFSAATAAAEELDPFFEDYDDDDDTRGGRLMLESPRCGQPSGSPSSVEALKGKHHCRTYQRRKMQQGKAIAGDDSGEEVHGPVAMMMNDAGSIEDIDSLEHHQLTEGGSSGVESCPICCQMLPTGISNVELNSHIDQCLAHYR